LHKPCLHRACAASLALIACTVTAPAAVAADWKPDKAVEFIVGTGPGSGVDNTARIAQSILQMQKIVEPQINVVNKPGGAYAVAYSYLSQFPGDGGKLAVQTSTPLAALLTGQLSVNYFELTPIANLITEPILLMVRAESPIASSKDLAQRLKADPAALSIALATARGNAFHITAALFARAAGADLKKLKIVVYGSSGEAVTALLGGHVDIVAVTPGNFLPLYETKKIRLLGIASPRRLGGLLATVPTFKEQGFDVVFDLPRSVMGAKGLTPDQVRYWDNAFGRMVKTNEWRQAVEKNQWEADYMNSADLGKSLKAQYEILKDVLTELGMVKQ
jgi:putative tricarboxylic transport membrane protein